MTGASHRWHADYPGILRETGFQFNCNECTSFDQNTLDSLDINQIIQEGDTLTVDRYVLNVLYYKLNKEKISALDANFPKLFRLSQLSIEYLLQCKHYLDATIAHLVKDHKKLDQEKMKLTKINNAMKRKIKNLNTTINVYEKTKFANPNDIIEAHQCAVCGKFFCDEEYLTKHIFRRHVVFVDPDDTLDNEELNTVLDSEAKVDEIPLDTKCDTEMERLLAEITELKQKLRTLQKSEEENKRTNPVHSQDIDEIQQLRQQFYDVKKKFEQALLMLQEQPLGQDQFEYFLKIVLESWEVTFPNEDNINKNQDREIEFNIEHKKNSAQIETGKRPEDKSTNTVYKKLSKAGLPIENLSQFTNLFEILPTLNLNEITSEVERKMLEKHEADIDKFTEQIPDQRVEPVASSEQCFEERLNHLTKQNLTPEATPNESTNLDYITESTETNISQKLKQKKNEHEHLAKKSRVSTAKKKKRVTTELVSPEDIEEFERLLKKIILRTQKSQLTEKTEDTHSVTLTSVQKDEENVEPLITEPEMNIESIVEEAGSQKKTKETFQISSSLTMDKKAPIRDQNLLRKESEHQNELIKRIVIQDQSQPPTTETYDTNQFVYLNIKKQDKSKSMKEPLLQAEEADINSTYLPLSNQLNDLIETRSKATEQILITDLEIDKSINSDTKKEKHKVNLSLLKQGLAVTTEITPGELIKSTTKLTEEKATGTEELVNIGSDRDGFKYTEKTSTDEKTDEFVPQTEMRQIKNGTTRTDLLTRKKKVKRKKPPKQEDRYMDETDSSVLENKETNISNKDVLQISSPVSEEEKLSVTEKVTSEKVEEQPKLTRKSSRIKEQVELMDTETSEFDNEANVTNMKDSNEIQRKSIENTVPKVNEQEILAEKKTRMKRQLLVTETVSYDFVENEESTDDEKKDWDKIISALSKNEDESTDDEKKDWDKIISALSKNEDESTDDEKKDWDKIISALSKNENESISTDNSSINSFDEIKEQEKLKENLKYELVKNKNQGYDLVVVQAMKGNERNKSQINLSSSETLARTEKEQPNRFKENKEVEYMQEVSQVKESLLIVESEIEESVYSETPVPTSVDEEKDYLKENSLTDSELDEKNSSRVEQLPLVVETKEIEQVDEQLYKEKKDKSKKKKATDTNREILLDRIIKSLSVEAQTEEYVKIVDEICQKWKDKLKKEKETNEKGKTLSVEQGIEEIRQIIEDVFREKKNQSKKGKARNGGREVPPVENKIEIIQSIEEMFSKKKDKKKKEKQSDKREQQSLSIETLTEESEDKPEKKAVRVTKETVPIKTVEEQKKLVKQDARLNDQIVTKTKANNSEQAAKKVDKSRNARKEITVQYNNPKIKQQIVNKTVAEKSTQVENNAKDKPKIEEVTIRKETKSRDKSETKRRNEKSLAVEPKEDESVQVKEKPKKETVPIKKEVASRQEVKEQKKNREKSTGIKKQSLSVEKEDKSVQVEEKPKKEMVPQRKEVSLQKEEKKSIEKSKAVKKQPLTNQEEITEYEQIIEEEIKEINAQKEGITPQATITKHPKRIEKSPRRRERSLEAKIDSGEYVPVLEEKEKSKNKKKRLEKIEVVEKPNKLKGTKKTDLINKTGSGLDESASSQVESTAESEYSKSSKSATSPKYTSSKSSAINHSTTTEKLIKNIKLHENQTIKLRTHENNKDEENISQESEVHTSDRNVENILTDNTQDKAIVQSNKDIKPASKIGKKYKSIPTEHKRKKKHPKERHFEKPEDIEIESTKELQYWDDYFYDEIPSGYSPDSARFTYRVKKKLRNNLHRDITADLSQESNAALLPKRYRNNLSVPSEESYISDADSDTSKGSFIEDLPQDSPDVPLNPESPRSTKSSADEKYKHNKLSSKSCWDKESTQILPKLDVNFDQKTSSNESEDSDRFTHRVRKRLRHNLNSDIQTYRSVESNPELLPKRYRYNASGSLTSRSIGSDSEKSNSSEESSDEETDYETQDNVSNVGPDQLEQSEKIVSNTRKSKKFKIPFKMSKKIQKVTNFYKKIWRQRKRIPTFKRKKSDVLEVTANEDMPSKNSSELSLQSAVERDANLFISTEDLPKFYETEVSKNANNLEEINTQRSDVSRISNRSKNNKEESLTEHHPNRLDTSSRDDDDDDSIEQVLHSHSSNSLRDSSNRVRGGADIRKKPKYISSRHIRRERIIDVSDEEMLKSHRSNLLKILFNSASTSEEITLDDDEIVEKLSNQSIVNTDKEQFLTHFNNIPKSSSSEDEATAINRSVMSTIMSEGSMKRSHNEEKFDVNPDSSNVSDLSKTNSKFTNVKKKQEMRDKPTLKNEARSSIFALMRNRNNKQSINKRTSSARSKLDKRELYFKSQDEIKLSFEEELRQFGIDSSISSISRAVYKDKLAYLQQKNKYLSSVSSNIIEELGQSFNTDYIKWCNFKQCDTESTSETISSTSYLKGKEAKFNLDKIRKSQKEISPSSTFIFSQTGADIEECSQLRNVKKLQLVSSGDSSPNRTERTTRGVLRSSKQSPIVHKKKVHFHKGYMLEDFEESINSNNDD